ncbi:MAG: zinc-dependent alcohol dehydrogenase [Acidobacteria bacterium]|nr:zinc-dependent alcohol dehydrogenase [Acidobacteriota bacterium]
MKAAVLRTLAEPLTHEELPQPEPAADEVLIRVKACGVCHSDLHIALGEWSQLKGITKLPLIPGHEIAGVVESVGANVTNFKPGDRVGVPWLHYTCGTCEYCQSGRETLCGKQQITGVMVDGGFAEFVKAKASHTVRVPDALSFEEAAPLMCAGLTVYKAMRVAEAKAGQRLAVFGVGGLGHLAIQLGKALGLEVGALDVNNDKLAFAKECGADWTVNVTAEAPHKLIKSQGGGPHIAMVTSGNTVAYDLALRSLRKGGTLAVVGMTPQPISVSTVALVSGEFRIVSSAVGTRADLEAVLAMAAEGKLKCHYETRPLEAINEVFDAMKAGQLTGRVVLTL